MLCEFTCRDALVRRGALWGRGRGRGFCRTDSCKWGWWVKVQVHQAVAAAIARFPSREDQHVPLCRPPCMRGPLPPASSRGRGHIYLQHIYYSPIRIPEPAWAGPRVRLGDSMALNLRAALWIHGAQAPYLPQPGLTPQPAHP